MAESARDQIDAILKGALELSDRERERFLDETCDRDTDLRRVVDRMLARCEADDVLLRPGGGAAGPLWESLAREHSAAFVFEPGERLGAYRVVRLLGHGGMATVYLAERADGQFEQAVALKVLDVARDFDALTARFAQERRILARLEHPNIARLIDGGSTRNGQPYVVMEYVDGQPIDRYCDERRLDVEQRIRLFAEVAAAVHYAHGHLIVHRDIKPSNILVTASGGVKLLDFGIAKLLESDSSAPVTRSALHPMTPEYASPEQVRGELLTTACDVYQLGYLLYRLLTGCTPYLVDSREVVAVIHAICNVEPTRPSQVVSQSHVSAPDGPMARSAARATTPVRLQRTLRGDLDNVLLTALRKEPERRYASVLHLGDDLKRHLEGRPVSARAPTLRYLTATFARRNRVGVAAGALLAVSLVVGLVATTWQSRVAAREAERASQALAFLVGLFESVDPDVTLGQRITAKELLDRGAAKLKDELAEVPALRAEMLGVVGRMYRELGLYKEARPILEEAREVQLALGEEVAEQRAQTATDLAWVLNEFGDHATAESLSREVVAHRRSRSADSPVELSNALSALGVFVSARGDDAEADNLFREALAIDRREGDRDSLAAHLADLGTSLWRRDEYDQARRAHEEALAIRRELHGHRHTLVAVSLLDLATVMMEQGEFPGSELLLREALQIQLELLGEGHPETARTLNNLGDALGRQEKFEESELMHRRALAARRNAYGDEHVSIAESMNNLAVLLYFRGRYSEAADLFEEMLPLWRRDRGDDHPDVLAAMNNLGAARRQEGNYAAAEPVLQEALELRRQIFGEQHPDVAQSLNQLAQLLHAMGRLGEAEARFRDAMTIWQATLGAEHPATASAMVGLGKLMLDRRDHRQAEALLRNGLGVRAAVLDPESALLAETRLFLGECLLEQGLLAEADSLIAASLPVLQAQWGREHDSTRRARAVRARIDTAQVATTR